MSKVTFIEHLKACAEAAKKFTNGIVGKLADTMVSAMEEMDNVKIDKTDAYTKGDIDEFIEGLLTEIEDNSQSLSNKIGNLQGLSTTNKTNIVNAINELFKKQNNIGQSGKGSQSEIFNDYVYNSSDGIYSHAEGTHTSASGNYSHTEGYHTSANGSYSHAGGCNTTANGISALAYGYQTTANAYQSVFGRYNSNASAPTSTSDSTGSLFVVGNGTMNYTSNAFRISANGICYGRQAFASSGADYAEYFEWIDGNPENEDRRGLFVTLDGEKIRIANANDDYILGIVSATPSVCGDIQSETWKDMYVKDVFGNGITETITIPETVDEETGQVIPAHPETQFVINPDYDPEMKYISREDRKEWAAIGLIGKLIVIDDGTCQINGYCKVADNGTATVSTEKTAYRVLNRIDENHIKIFIK